MLAYTPEVILESTTYVRVFACKTQYLHDLHGWIDAAVAAADNDGPSCSTIQWPVRKRMLEGKEEQEETCKKIKVLLS